MCKIFLPIPVAEVSVTRWRSVQWANGIDLSRWQYKTRKSATGSWWCHVVQQVDVM